MYPERLRHKAVTLIGPHWGGSFCSCLCVGVGLRMGVGAVLWADPHRTSKLPAAEAASGLNWNVGLSSNLSHPFFIFEVITFARWRIQWICFVVETWRLRNVVIFFILKNVLDIVHQIFVINIFTEVPPNSALTVSVTFVHFVGTKGLNLSLYTVWKGKSVCKAMAVDKDAFRHTQVAYM